MSLIKKIMTIPIVSKFMLNHYAPYKGAGIEIVKIDLPNYHIRVKMPLTRKKPKYRWCPFRRKPIFNGRPLLYVALNASFGAQIYYLG